MQPATYFTTVPVPVLVYVYSYRYSALPTAQALCCLPPALHKLGSQNCTGKWRFAKLKVEFEITFPIPPSPR